MIPAAVGRADVVTWQDGMRAQLERVLAELAAALDTLPADVRDLARQVVDRAPQLAERLVGLDALVDDPVQKIRIHGDCHLGPLLRTDAGFVVVDFEGEPSGPLAARRATECALKDVAGMLRSYAYAARAAMLRAAEVGVGGGLLERLEPWASAWQDGAQAAFVDGYLAETAARGASFLP